MLFVRYFVELKKKINILFTNKNTFFSLSNMMKIADTDININLLKRS